MNFTDEEKNTLPKLLSKPRFETYLSKTKHDIDKALQLYMWNIKMSSAFFIPINLCEISVRNSISRAIEETFSNKWTQRKEFLNTLPHSDKILHRYSPFQDLKQLQSKYKEEKDSGKIITNLKFVFWQKMFTDTHDKEIWNQYFKKFFPHTGCGTVQELRKDAFDILDNTRILRNRIAHHEPIFDRNLRTDFDLIKKIISWQCTVTAKWLDKIENVTEINNTKPKLN